MKKAAKKTGTISIPVWFGFEALKEQEVFIMGLREAKNFLIKLSREKIPNVPGIKCGILERSVRRMERDSIREIKGLIIAENRFGWLQVAVNWGGDQGDQYDIFQIHDYCLKRVTDEKVIKFATYCELKPSYFSSSPQPDAA